MGGLLTPLFLLGVAGIAIPLLVHLVQREQRDATAFPSLKFLERSPVPVAARKRIRNWPLFLARALIVLGLALAFARPVFTSPPPALAAADRRRDVVVLLDRSFSMRMGTRWAQARAEAARIIGTLRAGDRMTLVPFDRQARAVLGPTGDATALRAALDTIALTDDGTRLSPAVAVARQLLQVSDAPQKLVVVISDFQRTAWDLAEDARMPSGTDVRPVDVAGTPVRDYAVRAVEVRRDTAGDARRVVVSARVANVGPAVRALRLTLAVAGRTMETKPFDLPADGGTTVAFASVSAPATPTPAQVAVTGDQLAADDTFHFLLGRAPLVPVVVIGDDTAPFLTRALSIGDAPAFDVVRRTSGGATARDLNGRRVVILTDGALPATIGGQRLTDYVRDGGGLVVALGAATNPRTWKSAAPSLVPGTVGPLIDRAIDAGAVLGFVDRTHPALSVFAGAAGGDLSAARFQRYRAIDTTAGVLARFDDGSVALTEHHVGRGRVVTWASSLDGLWNDLPRQAVFLPFVHQLVRYAAAYRPERYAVAIGETVRPADLPSPPGDPVARWSVVTPSGARLALADSASAGTPRVLELREAGIYALRPSGRPTAAPLLVAANIAPAELDFATYDVTRLTQALAPDNRVSLADSASQPATLAAREETQSMWWYLLAAVFGLLMTESLLVRRAVPPVREGVVR